MGRKRNRKRTKSTTNKRQQKIHVQTRSTSVLKMEDMGLGPLWVKVMDPASGRPYYYHRITREVSWDNPDTAANANTAVATNIGTHVTNTTPDTNANAGDHEKAVNIANAISVEANHSEALSKSSSANSTRASPVFKSPTVNSATDNDSTSVLARFLNNLERSQSEKPVRINHATEKGYPLKIKGIDIRFPFAKPHAPQKVLMMKVRELINFYRFALENQIHKVAYTHSQIYANKDARCFQHGWPRPVGESDRNRSCPPP